MLGDEGWGRPEHDDRNPIKGISIVMLALQAFWLCAMGLCGKPPARRRRLLITFGHKSNAPPWQRAAEVVHWAKESCCRKKTCFKHHLTINITVVVQELLPCLFLARTLK